MSLLPGDEAVHDHANGQGGVVVPEDDVIVGVEDEPRRVLLACRVVEGHLGVNAVIELYENYFYLRG